LDHAALQQLVYRTGLYCICVVSLNLLTLCSPELHIPMLSETSTIFKLVTFACCCVVLLCAGSQAQAQAQAQSLGWGGT
jgi:hypothetical protein